MRMRFLVCRTERSVVHRGFMAAVFFFFSIFFFFWLCSSTSVVGGLLNRPCPASTGVIVFFSPRCHRRSTYGDMQEVGIVM